MRWDSKDALQFFYKNHRVRIGRWGRHFYCYVDPLNLNTGSYYNQPERLNDSQNYSSQQVWDIIEAITSGYIVGSP